MKYFKIALIALVAFCAIGEAQAQTGTKRSRSYLRSKFQTGLKPTQSDYYDWQKSYFHLDEDSLYFTQIRGIDTLTTSVTLTGASHRQLASALAIKTYVDNSVGAIGGLSNGDKGDITLSGSPAGSVMNIDADAVGATEIATGSVGTDEIANGAVSNSDLATMSTATFKGNVSGSTASPSDLTASQVKTALAIQTTDVSNYDEATEDKIGSKLVAGSNVTITYNDSNGETTVAASGGGGLSDGDKGDITVSGSGATWNVDAGVIGTTEIADNSVTSAKIPADAVTASQIVADGVGSSEIAANAVDASEIAANAVGNSEMADNAIGSAEVVNASIALVDLANDATISGNANTGSDTLTNAFQKIIVDLNDGSLATRNNGTTTQRTLANGFNVLLSNATSSTGGTFTPDLSAGTVFRHTVSSGSTLTVANATNNAGGRVGTPYRTLLKNSSGGSLTVSFGTNWLEQDWTQASNLTLANNDSIILDWKSEFKGGAFRLTAMSDLGGATSGGGGGATDARVRTLLNYNLMDRTVAELAENEAIVIIIGGQSNAQGAGRDSSALSTEIDLDTMVQIFNPISQTWGSLNIGANHTFGRFSYQHGIELQLQNIRASQFPNKKLYIIKSAQGGTAITTHLENETNYDSLWTKNITKAINLLIDQRLVPTVSLFWMQGESDVTILGNANAYNANLRKWVAQWQRNLGANVPIMIGRIDHMTSSTYTSTVNAAQLAVAADFETVVSFSTLGLTKSDASHFDFDGQKGLANLVWSCLTDTLQTPGLRIYEKLPRGQAAVVSGDGNGILAGGTVQMAAAATVVSQATEDISFNSPTTSPLFKIEVDNDRVEIGAGKAIINTDGRMSLNNAATANLTTALIDTRAGTAFSTSSGLAYGQYMYVGQGGNNTATTAYYAEPRKTAGSGSNLLGLWVRPSAATGTTIPTVYGIRTGPITLDGTASVTDAYGYYIDAQDVTNVGTGYGIWQDGTADLNLFRGKVGIGVTPTRLLDVQTTDANNTSIATNFATIHSTTGNNANVGLGVTAANAMLQSGSNSIIQAATMKVLWTDHISGTEDADAYFETRAAGTLAERLRIISTGQIKLNNYTATSSFAGTTVGLLGFDASGNVTSDAAGDVLANYWALGTQALAATSSIGSNNAFGFNLTTNGTARLRLDSGGRLFSGTITDLVATASDSIALNSAGPDLHMTSGFARFYDNSNVNRLQLNGSTGAVAITTPDNTGTAFSVTIESGNNFLLANSTDGAEVLSVGSSSTGATLNLVSEATAIAGSIGVARRTITASGTTALTVGDHYIRLDATAGAQTITLVGSPAINMVLKFKRIDNNPATVITFTGTVDGSVNPTSTGGGSPIAVLATQYKGLELTWNGTNWDLTNSF